MYVSTLSLEERVQIAADKGCKIATEDWTGTEQGTIELSEFLDSLDVPRRQENDD